MHTISVLRRLLLCYFLRLSVTEPTSNRVFHINSRRLTKIYRQTRGVARGGRWLCPAAGRSSAPSGKKDMSVTNRYQAQASVN